MLPTEGAFVKYFIVLISIVISVPSLAAIYLVAPKSLTVKNESGTSCLAEKNGQVADLAAPHVRFPVTLANPERSSFVPASFRIVIFVKGQPLTCDIGGEVMKASGMGFPVPYGYQMTSSCDIGCGDIQIPVGKKYYGTVEVFGHFLLPDGTKKTAFQEASIEVSNLGN